MGGFLGALLLSVGLGSAAAPPPAVPTISAPAPPSPLADSVAAPVSTSAALPADPHLAGSYFGARYYGSRIGRFTTVDLLMSIQKNLLDPQGWNRYGYGRNNPLFYLDPDGRVERTPVDARLIAEARARSGYVDQGTGSVMLDTVLPAVGLGVTVGPLVVLVAEAAPAVLTEALIAGGRCGVSAGCRGFIQDVAEGVSGASWAPAIAHLIARRGIRESSYSSARYATRDRGSRREQPWLANRDARERFTRGSRTHGA
jgi:RHS repeat-associated protein